MSYVDNLAETTPLVQKATTKPLRVSALIVEACDCNCMCSGTNTCTAGAPPAELTPFSQCADAHHSDAACQTSAGLLVAAAGVAAAL